MPGCIIYIRWKETTKPWVLVGDAFIDKLFFTLFAFFFFFFFYCLCFYTLTSAWLLWLESFGLSVTGMYDCKCTLVWKNDLCSQRSGFQSVYRKWVEGGGWQVCVCERVRVTQSPPPRRGSHVGCHSTGHWAPPAAPVISLACQPFDGKADTHTYLRHSSHGQAPGKTVIRSSVNASSGDSWGLKFKENSKHKEQFASSIISQANKEPFAACPGLMCCIGWQLESTVASHAAILLSLPLSHWHTDTVTKASF